ncbi:MAG: hypothetical protein HY515_03255 [Candidatus Aenigmarchaeota archaeon]|nr:hypothetical protein [Candidatus Aenigmarchaeota archaeon]
MKSTAVAHPTQSLIRYDWLYRDPDVPSNGNVSVCMENLYTTTTVETSETDRIFINGEEADRNDRAFRMLDRFRDMFRLNYPVVVHSENSGPNGIIGYDQAKGVGFSTSGGASLVTSLLDLFGLNNILESTEEYTRVMSKLSGSGVKSAVGGISYWNVINGVPDVYVLASRASIPDFRILCVPISNEIVIPTAEIHRQMERSPISRLRQEKVRDYLVRVVEYARESDVEGVSYVSQLDSLLFHETLEKGPGNLSVLSKQSLGISGRMKELRGGYEDPGEVISHGFIPVYVSWSGGPTTYINFRAGYQDEILRHLDDAEVRKFILSGIGEGCRIIDQHIA